MAKQIMLSDSGRTHREPLEAALYPARCYGMVVTGTTFSEMFQNNQTKVVILWELPTEMIDIQDDDGKTRTLPRGISATYTLSLNEKANLRKTLEGWRGKPFTPEELKGFNIASVVGAPCMLNIIVAQSKTDGHSFNRIAGVSRVMKGMTVPELTNEAVVFNILDADQDMADMAKLPQWLQDRIKESDEYKLRFNYVDGATPFDEPGDEDVPPIAANSEDMPF